MVNSTLAAVVATTTPVRNTHGARMRKTTTAQAVAVPMAAATRPVANPSILNSVTNALSTLVRVAPNTLNTTAS